MQDGRQSNDKVIARQCDAFRQIVTDCNALYRHATEGAILYQFRAYQAVLRDPKILDPVQEIAAIVKTTPGTIVKACANGTNISGPQWMLLEKHYGVTWYTDWLKLQKEKLEQQGDK